jgi:hypothetical protein
VERTEAAQGRFGYDSCERTVESLFGNRRSNRAEMTTNEQANLYFVFGKRMRIIN